MKNVLLFACLLIGASPSATAQINVPRLNIQYGDSNCYTDSTVLWTSLPDRGLGLEAVMTTRHLHVTTAVAWIGTHEVNLPWMNKYGKKCHFLAWPQIVFFVPMYLGYGGIHMFQIPRSASLVGLQIYAQGALDTGAQEEWSRGVEMVIQ